MPMSGRPSFLRLQPQLHRTADDRARLWLSHCVLVSGSGDRLPV
jgi:hypothetical protein